MHIRLDLSSLGECGGDDYQVVVATHLNTCHYHNHFIVNSVSFKHGKRLRAKQWYELNKVSDEICREHGLSVIEERGASGLSRQIRDIEQSGGYTRYNIARDAIDEAIKLSTNIKELELSLKSMGYHCNFSPNRKHWTVKLETWQRPIRIDRIGSEYTNQRLMERISEGIENKTFALFQKSFYVHRYQYRIQTRAGKIKKVRGLKGLYLRYCYLLGYVRRTVSKGLGGRLFINDTTKTENGMRDVPISSHLEPLLRQAINNMKDNPEGVIFYDYTGEKIISTERVNAQFRTILKKADISPRGQHALRHTFATRCIESGIPAVVLKNWMGHSDIHMTLDVYADVFSSMNNDAINKLSEHLKDVR